jgi:hypothetical protein
MSEPAFFRDKDLGVLRADFERIFGRLERLIQSGAVVCWPRDDIGTGLAQLPTRAPVVFAYIVERRERLISLAREYG